MSLFSGYMHTGAVLNANQSQRSRLAHPQTSSQRTIPDCVCHSQIFHLIEASVALRRMLIPRRELIIPYAPNMLSSDKSRDFGDERRILVESARENTTKMILPSRISQMLLVFPAKSPSNEDQARARTIICAFASNKWMFHTGVVSLRPSKCRLISKHMDEICEIC